MHTQLCMDIKEYLGDSPYRFTSENIFTLLCMHPKPVQASSLPLFLLSTDTGMHLNGYGLNCAAAKDRETYPILRGL